MRQLTILVVFIALGADALTRHTHFSSISKNVQKQKHHHLHRSFEESVDAQAIRSLIAIVDRRFATKISVAEFSKFSSSGSLESATEYFARRMFTQSDLETIEQLGVSPEICVRLIAVSEADIDIGADSTKDAIESLVESVTHQKFRHELEDRGELKKRDAKKTYIQDLKAEGLKDTYIESLLDKIDEVIEAAIELSDDARYMTKSSKYLFKGTSPSGDFAEFRGELDLEYHGHYSSQRIAFQDALLQRYLAGKRPSSSEPWLLFSGGPMGAGKGYVMANLDENSLLPVREFLVSDFDDIREKLPEYSFMNAINPKAMGHFTQPEVAMLSELLQNIGLAEGLNVLVDGSLQNAGWYSQVFTTLKEKYSNYRFALIFVIADLDQVKKQVAIREQKVGRSVPSSVVESAYSSCVTSMKTLPTHPAIDLSFIFFNQNGKAPILVEKRVRSGISDFGILEDLAAVKPSSQKLSILDETN